LFTRINPAAWLFALLFAGQAALLFRAARGPVAYFADAGPKRVLGIALVLYALVYPFLTLALGRTYPATPTFGVPCPTDLLTIGTLLTARGGVPVRLAIIPVIWGFVGGSAALLFGVRTDYVLLAAGMALPVALMAQRRPCGGDVYVDTDVSIAPSVPVMNSRSGWRTVSTGHGAERTTRSATLPINK
jgi:hypothetical protein